MTIRKFFNIFSKKESELIQLDIELILNRSKIIMNMENNEQQQYKKYYDNTCPNCNNSNSKTIVNKIISQQNNVYINFALYNDVDKFNNINKSNFIEINHCNACGNEWFKFKTKTLNVSTIITVLLKYIAYNIEHPNDDILDWKKEIIQQVFDGCHAESIYRLKKQHVKYLPPHINNILSLYNLRKLYKSVFD